MFIAENWSEIKIEILTQPGEITTTKIGHCEIGKVVSRNTRSLMKRLNSVPANANMESLNSGKHSPA